jgi:hypothetical protein
MVTVKSSLYIWIVLLVSLGTVVKAGNCSLASINGDFGFVEQGTVLLAPPAPPMVPYATSGILTSDGAGHLSGTVTVHAGGTVHLGTFNGTYAVNPDCTFSIQFTTEDNSVFHVVGTITGEGIFQEARYIYTDANFIVSGTAKGSSSQK